ncbi:MAG TPA: DUF2059 domain-containing protein, partial [Alphaproteobacteria bacterium]
MRSLITVALALVLLGQEPARADETAFDPERLALAREMVEVSGAGALSMQMLELVNAQISSLIRQYNPDRGAAAAEIVDAVLMPEFRRRLPEMSEAVARIYAERFTAAELKDVVDFYRTATGQKLVASGSE